MLKCPICGNNLNIVDSKHPLWTAYECKECRLIVLKLKPREKNEEERVDERFPWILRVSWI